jgi:hypothetical protein
LLDVIITNRIFGLTPSYRKDAKAAMNKYGKMKILRSLRYLFAVFRDLYRQWQYEFNGFSQADL